MGDRRVDTIDFIGSYFSVVTLRGFRDHTVSGRAWRRITFLPSGR
jgi:hypothetical protein